MKVYIVFYKNFLGDDIFCGVFASQEAAQKYADTLKGINPKFEFKVEEWEVRGE